MTMLGSKCGEEKNCPPYLNEVIVHNIVNREGNPIIGKNSPSLFTMPRIIVLARKNCLNRL